MGNKEARVQPSFSPSTGLMPHGTVKEQLEALLKEGFFDQVDTCIIGVSTLDDYNTLQLGKYWDCLALDAILHENLIRGMWS